MYYIRQISTNSFYIQQLFFTKMNSNFSNNNGLKLHVENASKI